MATSGTTSFDLQIDDIVDEAYERCGIGTEAGFDLKKARVSLNILFSEWGNRGIHLWKVALQSTTLVAGTTSYLTPTDCWDVLEAVVRDTSGNDVALTKISRSQYSAIPNKSDQGSWIHPDLAVNLAQWISPTFAIQVSRWVRELYFTGSVTLGNEKTALELLELQKDYKKLETKYRQTLQKKIAKSKQAAR